MTTNNKQSEYKPEQEDWRVELNNKMIEIRKSWGEFSDNCQDELFELVERTLEDIVIKESKRELQEDWQERFDKEFCYTTSKGVRIKIKWYMAQDIKAFIQKLLDQALDRQRTQHSATLALVIEQHKKELAAGWEDELDNWYLFKAKIFGRHSEFWNYPKEKTIHMLEVYRTKELAAEREKVSEEIFSRIPGEYDPIGGKELWEYLKELEDKYLKKKEDK